MKVFLQKKEKATDRQPKSPLPNQAFFLSHLRYRMKSNPSILKARDFPHFRRCFLIFSRIPRGREEGEKTFLKKKGLTLFSAGGGGNRKGGEAFSRENFEPYELHAERSGREKENKEGIVKRVTRGPEARLT